jgi:hypothetical protein
MFLGAGSGLDEAKQRVFLRRLERFVTFHARVPYMDSLAAMRASDALLLIDADAEINVFLPSKIADYFMARRHIVALTPPGATASALSGLEQTVVAPHDVAGIVAAVEGLIDKHRSGTPLATPSAAGTFGSRPIAARFAALLDEVTR